jgi:hypothetical protein
MSVEERSNGDDGGEVILLQDKKQNATFLFFRFALFGGASRLWDELRKKVVVGDIEIAIEFQLPSGGQSPVVHTFLSGILATIGAPPSRRLRK